jgi:hypothetical protein
MVNSSARLHVTARALAGAVALACAGLLPGCADMSDSMTSAFADPAKYQLYNCKQLETERKTLAAKLAELQGLMSKAQEGAGGAIVAEVAYRNEYIAVRGQAKNAEEAWVVNKCRETPGGQAAAPVAAPAVDKPISTMPTMKGGRVVY